MTEDQMKAEIAMSQIKKPHSEFSPEAMHETLDALNLIGKYDARPNS